jgi:hypothetical protein
LRSFGMKVYSPRGTECPRQHLTAWLRYWYLFFRET